MSEGKTEEKRKDIPQAVISRLPKYYRHLGLLMDEGVERISSADLSTQMNVTASQIRQDLNHFGGFGQQGYGYNVENLRSEIGRILGLDHDYAMIIVGAGRIGLAIANYTRFENMRIGIAGIFDRTPSKFQGREFRGVPVRALEEIPDFLRENRVDIAALTLPSEAAAQIAPKLFEGGVHGIWNFSHMQIEAPPGVTIQDVHLSESLLELMCRMNRTKPGYYSQPFAPAAKGV